jgi:4-hydroxybenzoate polyprenyltransferase
MIKYLKWYRWVDILSLDVAAGAVICSYYFSTIFSVSVSPVTLFVLGLSVWIIYTADHLKDASRINDVATTPRHKFHQQYFTTLFISIIIGGVIIISLLLTLDKYTLLGGLKLSIVVLIYLVINHFLSYTKELIGGLLYCLGVLLPATSQTNAPLEFLARNEVILFSLLVIINLLLFSGNELEEDNKDNHKSFALRFGKRATLIVIKTLISLVALILLLSWPDLGLQSRIIFCLMTGVLMAIAAFPNTFKKHDRYRYWGDLIFLFPAIVLIA